MTKRLGPMGATCNNTPRVLTWMLLEHLIMPWSREEILEEARQISSSRFKNEYSKTSFRNGFAGRGILSQPADEQKKTEEKPPWSDSLRTLKAQRRARGECFKCGEKYQPGHKCTKTVSLNVVEELLELRTAAC
nr:uncharacterized protein LOC127346563 [Lolium perenne]